MIIELFWKIFLFSTKCMSLNDHSGHKWFPSNFNWSASLCKLQITLLFRHRVQGLIDISDFSLLRIQQYSHSNFKIVNEPILIYPTENVHAQNRRWFTNILVNNPHNYKFKYDSASEARTTLTIQIPNMHIDDYFPVRKSTLCRSRHNTLSRSRSQPVRFYLSAR